MCLTYRILKQGLSVRSNQFSLDLMLHCVCVCAEREMQVHLFVCFGLFSMFKSALFSIVKLVQFINLMCCILQHKANVITMTLHKTKQCKTAWVRLRKSVCY